MEFPPHLVDDVVVCLLTLDHVPDVVVDTVWHMKVVNGFRPLASGHALGGLLVLLRHPALLQEDRAAGGGQSDARPGGFDITDDDPVVHAGVLERLNVEHLVLGAHLAM